MTPDTLLQSLTKGRLLAAVLCVVAAVLSIWGIDFSAEDQSAVAETLAGVIAGLASIVAIFSKLREKKKVGNSGKASIGLLALMVVLCLAVIAGCSSGMFGSSFCSNIPSDERSLICEVAHKIGIEPEDISGPLKISNATGLGVDLYSAEQAWNLFDRLDKKVALFEAGGGTLRDVILYCSEQYGMLPPKVQVLISLSPGLLNINMPEVYLPLYAYDWYGIHKHIAEQKGIISAFAALE